MHLHESSENGIDILELSGEIDLHFAPVFRTLLQAKAKERCPSLLLDMTQVEFIDSTSIAAILEYLRESTHFGGRFCIGGLSPQLRTIFEMVRLDKGMPIFTDFTEAKEALVQNRLPPPEEPLFASAA